MAGVTLEFLTIEEVKVLRLSLWVRLFGHICILPLLYARGHRVASTLCSVLDRVLLESAQVSKALSTPHTFELGLSGVDASMFGQVLALLEALVAGWTFEGLLTGVDAPVALHLRGVFEALLAVGAFKRLLASRVAVVLHKL